ncbi:MAG TPA: 50S ribosomal protein L22 [Vitreimonas sp.]|nr:50S ribosomal protein L22 [Vitreimonas sp.]
MLITAQQKYIRQTPRKLRLVANTVKKLSLDKAINQLAVIERRATLPVMKVVKQAVANALNNHKLQFSDLVLKDIQVGEGPRYRRFRAVSRGRAHDVKKRTSHVTVTLMTRDEIKPVAAPAAEPVKKAVKQDKSTKKETK